MHTCQVSAKLTAPMHDTPPVEVTQAGCGAAQLNRDT